MSTYLFTRYQRQRQQRAQAAQREALLHAEYLAAQAAYDAALTRWQAAQGAYDWATGPWVTQATHELNHAEEGVRVALRRVRLLSGVAQA